ncbi:hypothetical protein BDR04DRAFT_1121330 [Suillus decipiens]|nr:hypothetical protein BDR04DRAFT_1121330 [Suillus decipiens]
MPILPPHEANLPRLNAKHALYVKRGIAMMYCLVVIDTQDLDSTNASDTESQFSDFSKEVEHLEEVISLDRQSSDWVNKLQQLDEKACERLEAEQHLTKRQDMHSRVEEACRELEHKLNHIKRCLIDQ